MVSELSDFQFVLLNTLFIAAFRSWYQGSILAARGFFHCF